MNHLLKIKHLGPIEECEIEITQFTVLTGPQSNGKSTVAKAVYFFRTVKQDILQIMMQGGPKVITGKDNMLWERLLTQRLKDKFMQLFGTSWVMPQFKVDGGIIPKNAPDSRCDYLLLNDKKETAYFIELKGSDIEKAISQIENSIAMFRHEIPQYKLFRRIVYRTGSHDVRLSSVTRWKKRFGNGGAIVSERKYEENI